MIPGRDHKRYALPQALGSVLLRQGPNVPLPHPKQPRCVQCIPTCKSQINGGKCMVNLGGRQEGLDRVRSKSHSAGELSPYGMFNLYVPKLHPWW